MEKNILKEYNFTSIPVKYKRTSKSVQYFTLGKDNCLIHHPTSHNKKSSPSAVFCRTDPFQTKHKKAKSTLPKPCTHGKYTVTTNLQQEAALSKLATNLRQVNAALSPNSDIFSTIIEGKSLKLNSKTKSCSESSSYCERIKRCKMCGEVMLGLDPMSSHGDRPSSSSDTYSGPVNHTVTNIVGLEEKAKKVPHKHNSRIKRCVICSKFFIQPYDSKYCKDCPSSEGFKDSKEFLTKYGTATTNKETSSLTIPLNVASSSSSIGHSNKRSGYKTSQLVKSNNLPEKSNYSKDKLMQTKINICKPSLKKTTFDSKETFNAKSKVSSQSKSVLKTNGISTKAKDPTKTISFESNIEQKQSKEASPNRKKAAGSKASIDSIAKALSERNQAFSIPKNTTEKLQSKSYFDKKQSGKINVPTIRNIGKIPNCIPPTFSKTKQADLEFPDILEEYTSKSAFNESQLKNKNIESNRAYTKRSNMPIRTQSLFEANQGFINTSDKASEELISDSICIDREECSSINISNKRSSTDDINLPKQTNSLPETDLAAKKTSSERKSTRESQVGEKENNSKSGASTEDTDIPNQNNSLNDPDQIIDKCKESSKTFTPVSLNGNKPGNYPTMVNKSTSTDKLNGATYGSLSQMEEDLLSKFANMLDQNKDVNSSTRNRPSSPVFQNVTVNNYYFVSGSDVQKALCNSSISRVPSNISLISDNEDELEANKVTHDNVKNLNISSMQPELSKSFLEKLFAKHNTNNLCDSLNSQSVISLYGGTCSDLESDNSQLGQSGINSYNLHHNSLGQRMLSKSSKLSINKQCQLPNLDAQSLYAINPYIQKSLRIFEEMERVRNDPIDQEKILEELKKNKDLMKIIDQMATKKLNFSRKSTVFKNVASQ